MAATGCGVIAYLRDERHAAFRTASRLCGVYLRVHRAGVGSCGCRRSGRRRAVCTVSGHHTRGAAAAVVAPQTTGWGERHGRRRGGGLGGGGARRMRVRNRRQRTGRAAYEESCSSTIKLRAIDHDLDLQAEREERCARWARGRTKAGGDAAGADSRWGGDQIRRTHFWRSSARVGGPWITASGRRSVACGFSGGTMPKRSTFVRGCGAARGLAPLSALAATTCA